MNTALAILRTNEVKTLFNDAGLAFSRVLSPPRESNEQLGDRWERRVQADIEFRYTSLVTDKPAAGSGSWIETADDTEITYL